MARARAPRRAACSRDSSTTNAAPPEGTKPRTPRPNGPFFSSDYRLSAFRSYTYGLKAIWTVNPHWQLDLSIERYDIDLWFTSRVFESGHRIRVSVSSALFPKYDRNLNTGGNNERDSGFVVAHQRLVHDAARPSRVVLPMIPR